MGISRRRDAEAELNLPPGFRFHPTDEELVVHYLCRKATGQRLPVPIIAEVDLYKFDPWQLPEKALFGQREWYFFTPRDRKYPNGSRPNRAAGNGYWKATGADKPVAPKGSGKTAGIKKALVFYSGKAPKGVKTDWIMHEYRLADAGRSKGKKGSSRLDDWVLCRLYNKKNEWEKMQRKQEEEAMDTGDEMTSSSHSHHTPESEVVDNDQFPELDYFPEFAGMLFEASGVQSDDAAATSGYQTVEQMDMKQEAGHDSEWSMGLNLDDFLSSYASLETLSDALNDDRFFSTLVSPRSRTNQPGVPPF